jgi:L-amino acid N-acyltransferase YncA
MIRDARESDSAAVAAIYAHHVMHGTATYDFDPPPTVEHVAKMRNVISAGWPYLVADEDGIVAGYAYAAQIRDRPGYAWTAEDSLYVHPEMTGKGVAPRCSKNCAAGPKLVDSGR